MATDTGVTYASYLMVDDLLGLQVPKSEPQHPDELQFIVVHQASELWFKLILHDLDRVVEALGADDFELVTRLMARVNDCMDMVTTGLRSLQTLPPWSLHEFRGYLGTSSGLQSVQFREIELLGGIRDPRLRRVLDDTYPDTPEQLNRRARGQSVSDAHRAAAERAGLSSWEQLYVDSSAWGPLYLATEALMAFDRAFVRWRREHVTLIEGILGPRTRGSAGMALSYLIKTEEFRFFPYLWDVRHELTIRGDGELVGGPPARRDGA
ncbi:tryptophan 2,3-dioxygenase family protein [Actinomadura syzygii]|uniref:Tryptophan 2,3-dioxygenase n=1 Tax=Actinomadura syzygii TaxID=1427538 RepID=A0A5D0TQH7_9ACTN|nr:tryptophan 2,3-dioxygenase family protein [Actinomadura syzygii]TYC07596.1 hypothetical protein FXF65_42105 [Actinomadura syzygii]